MSPYLTGRNAVLEAIKAGSRVRRVLYESAGAELRGPLREVLDAARAANVAVERSTRSRLDAIHPRHQGIVAEVQAFSYVPFASVVERCRMDGDNALVLLLDELQDPQNLGTLLRTAL